MGSLELLSYFWSLNTIVFVKIENFDFDVLRYHPNLGPQIWGPKVREPSPKAQGLIALESES